jgi:hypothetical protein
MPLLKKTSKAHFELSNVVSGQKLKKLLSSNEAC